MVPPKLGKENVTPSKNSNHESPTPSQGSRAFNGSGSSPPTGPKGWQAASSTSPTQRGPRMASANYNPATPPRHASQLNRTPTNHTPSPSTTPGRLGQPQRGHYGRPVNKLMNNTPSSQNSPNSNTPHSGQSGNKRVLNPTRSDEELNVKNQPPPKKPVFNHQKSILIGQLRDAGHVDVHGTTESKNRLIITELRGNTTIEMSQVNFLPDVSEYISRDKSKKEEQILKYMATQTQVYNSMFTPPTPERARAMRDLKIDIHTRLPGPIRNAEIESPIPNSPKPDLDIRVGVDKKFGFPVYAYYNRQRGVVVFRSHKSEGINAGKGTNETLGVMKEKIEDKNIDFTGAYQRRSVDQVKSDVLATMQARGDAFTMQPREHAATVQSRGITNAPALGVGGALLAESVGEDDVLVSATKSVKSLPRKVQGQVKKEESPAERNSDLDEQEQRLKEKEEALAIKYDELDGAMTGAIKTITDLRKDLRASKASN